MQLQSKVIAITGGSQGLGKVLAKACCEQGAKVAIIGRNAQKLEQAKSKIDIDVLGAMYCCREAIPLLKKSRGDIINVSSESVRFNPPMLSAYAASKAALETFSQSLRVD